MSITLDDFRLKLAYRLKQCVLTILPCVFVAGLACAVLANAEQPLTEPQLDEQGGRLSRNSAFEANPVFEEAVQAYREGRYPQADKLFTNLHRQTPENTKVTYYLAITEAQLGRFQAAKKMYTEVLTLDPKGEAARLAQEGLKYLPPEIGLDLPPRFSPQDQSHASVDNATQTLNPGAADSLQPNAGPSMSHEDLMALQMLMGQGSSSSNGNNPLGAFMPGMMGIPSNGINGMSGMDPKMMSTMMMNQMMQNMNLGGDQNENR
jgi:tetratricopeptide (TPR) repeat protein